MPGTSAGGSRRFTTVLALLAGLAVVVVIARQNGDQGHRTARSPDRIEIPGIGAESSLIPLGLEKDGTIEVPPVDDAMQAGWYELGPAAGETGPFVVLGHIDSHTDPGIFLRLHELGEGDLVRVYRVDKSVVTYVVDRTQKVGKDRFPTEAVYGNTTGPEIRLITCGGAFDRKRGSYEENLIVYGHLVESPA
ncbi:class F sortase [Saccharomonospora sp. NPDC006951]